ncbi:hypothetical protein [Fusobacterium periodonticum]|uniref:hypothetical protein n=1 Tax=Fusobacterium periodonticum TaxID=860 RepID=UPI0028D6717D|nr:hypothetical protein [Fusobacterium periodonticum]
MRITERSKMKLVEELRFKNIDEVMMYENELNEYLDKDYYFRLNRPYEYLDKDYYFRLNRPLFSEDFILEVYLYCPEQLLDY